MSIVKFTNAFIAFVLLGGAVASYLYHKYSEKSPNTANFMDQIRQDSKAGLGSLQNAINYENDLHYRIQKNISTGNFKTADSLMDSLPAFGKSNLIRLYKGMIYEQQKKCTEAIAEYNIVIAEQPFPANLNKRAETYIKMNKLDSALSDYKKSYLWNYDFSYKVAYAFELMHKKDSALKYYQIYLTHY